MILEMRDICKDYPMGKSVAHILKNVNLDVEEGEYLAIMGPSGSGKTTLMNLIGCLDVPTSGSYLLGGRDVTTCNNKQLAEVRNKELGFVFQSFNLLPKLTAVENVALPLLYGGVKKAERLERARAALETVGLSDRVDHRPDQLSGGQCQRVAIARAIVGKPKLLLADEPRHGVRHLKVEHVRFYKLAVDFHRDQCNDHTKKQAACCGVILTKHIGNGDLNVIYSGHNVSRQDGNKGTYSHNAGVRALA